MKNIVRQVLRPIVRLCLAKGLTFQQLGEILKGLYVEQALAAAPADRRTDSRVTLMTGIHRKDVKRLRTENADPETAPGSVSLGMRLFNAWQTPPFADEDGVPKPLPRHGRSAGDTSFDSLVASVSKDIRARSVLDEWTRLGIVAIDAGDVVRPLSDAFVPRHGFAEKAFYFGHNLHDHAAAATANLLAEGAPFFERSVHYNALPADAVAALAQDAGSGGMRLLRALNRKAQAAQSAAAETPGDRPQRFTCGVYFFAEDAPPAPEDAP